jgi:hypothetical protein
MKNKIVKTKEFVYKHRVAIAIVGTAAVCTFFMREAFGQYNDFLAEHDLYDAFFEKGME